MLLWGGLNTKYISPPNVESTNQPTNRSVQSEILVQLHDVLPRCVLLGFSRSRPQFTCLRVLARSLSRSYPGLRLRMVGDLSGDEYEPYHYVTNDILQGHEAKYQSEASELLLYSML